jgi:enediyne biosynthesis protein E5
VTAARRFFRTPKGVLTIVLVLLTLTAAVGEGFALIAPGVLAASAVAMLVDAPILRWREDRWEFPSGALLTGLLVAMVLSPHEPWHVVAITSAIGVASKYVVRTRSANVFNPAALALVATFYLFDTGHSWWGALPELPSLALVLLLITGVFITDRVNKMPLVLSFLGVYYLLATIAAFGGNAGTVAELYRAPDLHAALFFAFFMVTDPPTSPPKHRDQLVYGVIVAVVSFAVFELVGAVYFLLAGLLVANVWEAWRRTRAHARKAPRSATLQTSPT